MLAFWNYYIRYYFKLFCGMDLQNSWCNFYTVVGFIYYIGTPTVFDDEIFKGSARGETPGKGWQNATKILEYFVVRDWWNVFVSSETTDSIYQITSTAAYNWKSPQKTPFHRMSRDNICHGSLNILLAMSGEGVGGSGVLRSYARPAILKAENALGMSLRHLY